MPDLPTSNCFRDIGPDDAETFLLLPITGLFTERDELAIGSGTATYSTCPSSPQLSKFGRHNVQQMYLLMANENSGHRTDTHLCFGKLSDASQPSPGKIANRKELTGCTHHQIQTMGWTPHSQGNCQQQRLLASLRHCWRRNSSA